jgi:hypothetical protein
MDQPDWLTLDDIGRIQRVSGRGIHNAGVIHPGATKCDDTVEDKKAGKYSDEPVHFHQAPYPLFHHY